MSRNIGTDNLLQESTELRMLHIYHLALLLVCTDVYPSWRMYSLGTILRHRVGFLRYQLRARWQW